MKSRKNRKKIRCKPESTIEGMSIYEFILQNADPVWLLQEEMYPELDAWQRRQDAFLMNDAEKSSDEPGDKDLPF